MKIIVPMAGTGERFKKAGYKEPKPLIRVGGRRIIEYVLDMYDVNNDDITFICNEDHINNTDMKYTLLDLAPRAEVITIPNHKKGPVYTVASSGIIEKIKDDEQVIIAYCDNPFLWNYSHFKEWVKTIDCDGCVTSHCGFHPHRLSPTFQAHIKENNLKIEAIKEKEPYTNNPIAEHASTGTYYFKKGSYIKHYFKTAMERGATYGGEAYVTLVYNLLIEDGLSVWCYPSDIILTWGTPEEVENFEAWKTIIESTQVKSVDDAVNCYLYWKKYLSNK